MSSQQILNRIKKLEAFAQLALEEATAIRKELGGGTSSSPAKGKAQAAAHYCLMNRRKKLS